MWDNFLQNPMNLDMLKLSAPQMMPGVPTTTAPTQPSVGKGFDPSMFSMLARYGRPNTQSAQPMMTPQQMPTAPAPTSFAQGSPFAPPAPAAGQQNGAQSNLMTYYDIVRHSPGSFNNNFMDNMG